MVHLIGIYVNIGSDTLGWTEKLMASGIVTIQQGVDLLCQEKTYIYRRVQETNGSIV